MTRCELSFAMRQIPIHSWGGFGSQLFALALAIHFDHSSNLRTKIIFHEAGVTRRNAEIQNYCSRENLLSTADFEPASTKSQELGISVTMRLRKASKFILDKSGFVSSCDTDREVNKLKPWLREIRGHYSHRSIQISDLLALNSSLRSQDSRLSFEGKQDPSLLTIHYRLGDLVNLANKKPIPKSRLYKLIDGISSRYTINKIRLSSDSPALSLTHLRAAFPDDKPIQLMDLNSLETINHLQRGFLFIGTNSKISLWATLFRVHFFPLSESWMPEEMRGHLEMNLQDLSKLNRIHFY